MIERYNHEIKGGIRKLTAAYPSASWYELIPDVFFGLRVLPTTTTGYSAFELTYKYRPHLPLPLAFCAAPLEEVPLGWDKDVPADHLE